MQAPVGTDEWLVASLAAAPNQSDHVLALLQMQRELLAEAAAGADARAVLELLIELIESQVLGATASVLLVDHETDTLHTFSAPRLPESYNAAVDGVAIGPNVGFMHASPRRAGAG